MNSNSKIRIIFILIISVYTFINCVCNGEIKDSLIDACETNMANANYDEVRRLANDLLRRSVNNSSERDRAFASAYLGADAVTKGDLVRGFELLSSAKEWAKRENNDSVMALALNGMGIYYVMAESNTVVALKFLDEARKCASRANTTMLGSRIDSNIIQIAIIRNDTTMLDYAKHSFEESAHLPIPIARSIMARHIARLLILKKDYNGALKYLDIADKIGGENDKDRIVGIMLRGEIFNRQNKKDLALLNYQKALNLSTNVSQRADAYLGLAMVSLCAKDYAQCRDYALKVLKLGTDFSMNAYNEECYALLMKAYAGLDQWHEAYNYALKYNECLASRCDINNEYVQKQITTAMQVEKKVQEAEMQRKELSVMRQRAIILGTAFMIVLILSIILVREIKKKNRLYKTIVLQFKEAMANHDGTIPQSWHSSMKPTSEVSLINENRSFEDKSINKTASESEPILSGEGTDISSEIELSTEVAEELWNALIQKMEIEEVYRSPGLTRESLAKMIGTNRTYLSNIIYSHTGMNYPQFVNSYRINEAIRVLSDKSMDNYPIKALCHDIGFSSMTGFYKLFKERTRMTPSTFRKNS